MLKRVTAIFLLAAALYLLPACSNPSQQTNTPPQETKKEATVNTPKENTKEQEEDKKPEEPAVANFTFPDFTRRPYAVMIDNEGVKSLPQGGIDKAQIVYEVIVEGGETRLMPLYWGTAPDLIGPVRSSRHYFLDYAMEHDAIYIHFGWSPKAMSDIKTLKINNINGVANGGEIFFDLTKDRKNWQDSYTKAQSIQKYVQRVKYRTEAQKGKSAGIKYYTQDTELSAGKPAAAISLRYSSTYTCSYQYDAATKTYKRARKGKPHIERTTGKPFEAKNIIIQKSSSHTIKGDKAGRQEVGTVGSGTGWLVTDGKAVEITWSKASRSASTLYKEKDTGKPIELNPGQTWIQIMPSGAGIKIGE